MKDAREFCTCTDHECPFNPVNHEQGCTLCIQKNLKMKEIPSCFFHSIDCEKPTEGWHYQDFAALVEKAKSEDEKLLLVADRILNEHRAAFDELAK